MDAHSQYTQHDSVIFTRYLYVKNDVVWSLFYTLTWGDLDQSLFWAYELYYSGFHSEVFDILQFIYDECYRDSNPREVAAFLRKIRIMWEATPSRDELLATFVANILYRKHDIMAFVRKYDYEAYIREALPHETTPVPIENATPRKCIFVKYNESDIQAYKTVIPSKKVSVGRLLDSVQRYLPKTDGADYCRCLGNTIMGKYLDIPLSREEIRNLLVNGKWVYYAAATPLWAQRIQLYKGRINRDTKDVEFNNETIKESFYKKYGYTNLTGINIEFI